MKFIKICSFPLISRFCSVLNSSLRGIRNRSHKDMLQDLINFCLNFRAKFDRIFQTSKYFLYNYQNIHFSLKIVNFFLFWKMDFDRSPLASEGLPQDTGEVFRNFMIFKHFPFPGDPWDWCMLLKYSRFGVWLIGLNCYD